MLLIRASCGRIPALRVAGTLVALLATAVLVSLILGAFERSTQSDHQGRYVWAGTLALASYNVWAFTHGKMMLTGTVGKDTSAKSAHWRFLCVLLFAALATAAVIRLVA
jgi:hypothetical protein